MKTKDNLKALALALLAATYGISQEQPNPAKPLPPPGLTISTPAFLNGSVLPFRFTAADPNPVSPKIEWTHVPEGTVTFAMIMHDPDGAPQKRVEDPLHWLVFNIPGTAHELQEGVPPTAQLPDGSIQLKNIGGTIGYRAPGAPAPGPFHHYSFELFALDTQLNLGVNASRTDVMKAMDGHILAKAVVVGRFHR